MWSVPSPDRISTVFYGNGGTTTSNLEEKWSSYVFN